MMPHKSTVYEYEYEYETNLSHPIMSKVWKKFDANKKCWKTKKRSKECAFNSNRHILARRSQVGFYLVFTKTPKFPKSPTSECMQIAATAMLV